MAQPPMNIQLTTGILRRLLNEDNLNPQPNVILQVLDLKKIMPVESSNASGRTNERYRIELSDGQYRITSLLATQAHQLVNQGIFLPLSVIKLTQYQRHWVKDTKWVFVTLGAESVHPPLSSVIGNPQPLEPPPPPPPPGQNLQRPQQPFQQQLQPQYMKPPSTQPVPSNQRTGSTSYNPSPNPAGQQLPLQPQQQHPYQPPSMQIDTQNVFPIASLNPYQHRWTIKARCTFKSEIRHWQKEGKGSGQLFHVDLLDESGEIRATIFNDAVDKFFPIFSVGNIYYISKASVRYADKRFNPLRNDYELTLDVNAMVMPVNELSSTIPKAHYSFVDIDQLQDLPRDEAVDVIGILKEVGPLTTIKSSKTGRDISKRTIVLVDHTERTVNLTLWGEQAENFNPPLENTVVAAKNVRVSDFNGRSLSAVSGARLEFNPDISRTKELINWWTQQDPSTLIARLKPLATGAGGEGDALSRAPAPEKTFKQVRDEGLGLTQSDIFQTRATITMIKHDDNAPLYYNACPECNKKVQRQNNQWYCDKQCKKYFDAPIPRYILTLSASDSSGSLWINAFNDVGKIILERDAAEIAAMKEKNDPNLDRVFNDAIFKMYNMKIRARSEPTPEGESRVKYTLIGIAPVNFTEESAKILQKLQNPSAVQL
jgi:replication factor A1